ncbi:cytochrome c-550 PedF [Neomegalonema perideroedes]|uniref:cytochrome c-550 PedF n=1 Tax=Neomegalonema perideroedes TaxID=217219 RepID=UPI00037A240E|nr:cytochrome c-550 PedF [Neomegalonema perideroedes]
MKINLSAKLALMGLALSFAAFPASRGFSHGDTAPQAVDTEGLDSLGEGDEWLTVNPYRIEEGEEPNAQQTRAIEVGTVGYSQNCARCHGLEGVSGGMAPDLRYLDADEWGDEWYLDRIRNGVTQNGGVKMPPFADILNQEAAWAIRTYLETRPQD